MTTNDLPHSNAWGIGRAEGSSLTAPFAAGLALAARRGEAAAVARQSSGGWARARCGICSVVIFCKALLTCSTGSRADSAETMQPNCEPDLSNENKTKDHDLADDTQCTNMLLPGGQVCERFKRRIACFMSNGPEKGEDGDTIKGVGNLQPSCYASLRLALREPTRTLQLNRKPV